MKLIIITKGNQTEADDPHHFTTIYECDYFELVHYDDGETWFKLYGYPETPKTQKEMMVDYNPEIDDLIVLP